MSNIAVTYRLSINEKGVFENDQLHLQIASGTLSERLSTLYKELDINYPKFHKMDNLCKLAFLGTELLTSKMDISDYGDDEIGLVFVNNHSSLDTDTRHQQKIDDPEQKASPTIFVYTLPNILIGEIAIRYHWFGENLFVLADSFDQDKWMEMVEVLFDQKKANAVIGGWVDVFEEKFDLKLFFVKNDE